MVWCSYQCLYRHSRVCDHYGSDPSMRRAAELFSTLTVDVMSGDETAHEGGKVWYAVTKLKWWNPAVHAWMTTLDRLHLSTRFTAAGRASRGAFPHIRIPSSRSKHVDPVVPGLPINFYNPAYLRQLDGPQRDNLCMQNEFDMTFTPQIIRYYVICLPRMVNLSPDTCKTGLQRGLHQSQVVRLLLCPGTIHHFRLY